MNLTRGGIAKLYWNCLFVLIVLWLVLSKNGYLKMSLFIPYRIQCRAEHLGAAITELRL